MELWMVYNTKKADCFRDCNSYDFYTPVLNDIMGGVGPLEISNRPCENGIEPSTLQRHNTENSKHIFPEKELREASPSFHIDVSVCDCRFIYIYSQDQSAYSAAGKYVDRFLEYINRSQAHECGNWD
jgi:hypothetical protein